MDLTRVGRIGKSHGVEGEVRVVSGLADPETLGNRSHWIIGFDPEWVLLVKVEFVRRVGKNSSAMLAKLSCARSRTQASRLHGAAVFVPSAEVEVKLANDGAAMSGYRVLDQHGNLLGTVSDYIVMPAQNLIVMTGVDGNEVLIPDAPEIVRAVNADSGSVTIEAIDGLLDL